MKSLVIGLLAVGFVGCSVNREVVSVLKGDPGKDGSSCSVTAEELGTRITCSNGSSSLLLNGEPGATGITGSDGQSCSVTREETRAVITCGEQVAYVNDGTNGVNGADGQDGSDGQDGEDGVAGPPGPQGPPGTPGNPGQNGVGGATISTFTASSNCSKNVDTHNSVKKDGSTLKVYKTNNCSGHHVSVTKGHAYLTINGNLLFNEEAANQVVLVTFN